MTLAVGIDVGGTKIAAGLVDRDRGAVLRELRIPTAAGTRPPRAVLADCADLARRLASGGRLPVGVGICELVAVDGTIGSAVTVDWRDLDVASAFGAGLGTVTVESDVRAGGLAEAQFGAGAGRDPVVYVSIGTGISYALVVAGEVYRGGRGNAIVVGAPAVEQVAGGRALALAAGEPSAERVLADPRHEPLVRAATDALGLALAGLVNALDPEILVIGGGLGLVQGYREAAVAAMRPHIDSPGTRDLEVVPATLGAQAGIVGAALAAR